MSRRSPKTPIDEPCQDWKNTPQDREIWLAQTIDTLAAMHCVPCKGVPSMPLEEAHRLLTSLPSWTLEPKSQSLSIHKEFRFKTYLEGLDFANTVGRISEEEDHHPDMHVRWRRVKLTFSTHAIKGLSMNDFIMAAKSELEYRKHAAQ